MSKKGKITISIIIIGVVILGITFTLTYFRSNFISSKKIATDIFRATYTSTLDQPDSWVPGSSTTGNFKVKNESNMSVAVRARIEEHWYDASGTEVPSQVNSQDVAIKTIGTGWGLYDGWYYYYKTLDNQNDETSNFIPTVEFANIFGDSSTCTSNNDGTKTCAVGAPYSTDTYSLVVTFEVIQSDAYETEWAANVLNAEYNMRAYFNVDEDASVNVSEKGIALNQQIGELPTAIKEGYTFLGWFTESEGGDEVTPTTVVSSVADLNLYAHFKPTNYTVSFNSGTGFTQPSNLSVAYNSSNSFNLAIASGYRLNSITCDNNGYTPTYTFGDTGTISVTITNSNAITGTNCTINTVYFNPSNSYIKAAYVYNESSCQTGNELGCRLSSCVNSGSTCPVGTIIDYQVDSNTTDNTNKNDVTSGIMRFHVIKDNGTTMTMQSQRNVVKGVTWYSARTNSQGPLTILSSLESATIGWTLVRTQVYSIGNSSNTLGYSGCSNVGTCDHQVYTLSRSGSDQKKARLITMQEINAVDPSCTFDNGSCAKWLTNYLYKNDSYNNTYYDSTTGNYGYWIANGTGSITAWYINYVGSLTSNTCNPDPSGSGARAVIEINK